MNPIQFFTDKNAKHINETVVCSPQKQSFVQSQKSQRQLLEKLSRMNFEELVQEQRQRHPELNSLSQEHFTQILIGHIMNLQESQQ